jgi:hypothetical protein
MSDFKNFVHPEQRMENSLTAPSDRDPNRTYQPNQSYPELSNNEVIEAMKELNNSNFVKKFLSVERRYADPVDKLQRIGLLSFVPAKGATPNEKGIYGFAKLRGNFGTEQEANEKAEFLIKNVDSYHQIYHAYVGRPFPLTTSSDYSGDLSEVNIRNSMVESISSSIKKKKEEDHKQIQEIEQREKELLEDTKKEEADPIDLYTTLRVKKAQITWTYLETLKKIDEMKAIIIKSRSDIEELEKADSSHSENYFKKYCEAREKSGLDNSNIKDSFMKFLVEDVDLGF